MPGKTHEIRDAIHVFVRLDSDERKVVDSPPYQRLRDIHQLAMTYLVYPGATHRRFEHCLGVMEIASRIYDVVTHERNVTHELVRNYLPDKDYLVYWRRVLRMAALCHDLGHLPFSHGPEDLLPNGINHETLSLDIIRSAPMREHWDRMKLQTEDIAKLAVGGKKYGSEQLGNWESTLAEIIVGDAFGADRIDYLLRDSHHAGVAYGRFDHYRLIDTLRILPKGGESEEPTLGVEEGGLQSAEALLWARHFMYTQLYFHAIRRIYDLHLKDFLKDWLPGGLFSSSLEKHLEMTDNEVLAALAKAARDPAAKGHEHAHRIKYREHYRVLYKRNPTDQRVNKQSVSSVYEALSRRFGSDALRLDEYVARSRGIDFPVLTGEGRIESSLALSQTLEKVPAFAVGTVFIRPDLVDAGKRWLNSNRDTIIRADAQGA